jgi:hypothetical protein
MAPAHQADDPDGGIRLSLVGGDRLRSLHQIFSPSSHRGRTGAGCDSSPTSLRYSETLWSSFALPLGQLHEDTRGDRSSCLLSQAEPLIEDVANEADLLIEPAPFHLKLDDDPVELRDGDPLWKPCATCCCSDGGCRPWKTASVEDLDSIDSRYGEKTVVPRS